MRALQPADMGSVKTRSSTLDLLAAEFAAAVAEGDMDKAEGWLATATLVAARQAEVAPAPAPTRS